MWVIFLRKRFNMHKNKIIKFRIWDKKFKSFYYPSLYFLLQVDKNGELYYETGVSKRNNYILQQFIGLKDKKGKEIYEGDILELKQGKEIWEIGDVRFLEGAYYWWNSYGEQLRDYIKDKKSNTIDLKIIGNIFQNKELLG